MHNREREKRGEDVGTQKEVSHKNRQKQYARKGDRREKKDNIEGK